MDLLRTRACLPRPRAIFRPTFRTIMRTTRAQLLSPTTRRDFSGRTNEQTRRRRGRKICYVATTIAPISHCGGERREGGRGLLLLCVTLCNGKMSYITSRENPLSLCLAREGGKLLLLGLILDYWCSSRSNVMVEFVTRLITGTGMN